MDTSTPLKKSVVKNEKPESALPKECISDCSSCHLYQESEPFDCDRFHSDSYSKWTDANTSVQVFPLSPICCAKNPPSDLLDVLYSDSPNLKWSSSLHTSCGENEAVVMEKESANLTDTPYHYAANVGIVTPNAATAANASHENKSDVWLVDERFADSRNDTWNVVPPSPIFVCGGSRGRAAKRKKMKKPLDERVAQRQSLSDSEDARAFRALKLDDFYLQTLEPCTRSRRSTTSKPNRYSLDSGRENSKRFVYPFADISIKKPRMPLNVDQLTNCALSLEASDTARSRADPSRHFVDGLTKAETGVGAQARAQTAMLAFSQLYDDRRVVGERSYRPSDESTNDRVRRSRPPNATRALADILFARKLHDRDTVRGRFDKMAYQLTVADGEYRSRARVTCALYSAYYFVARVHWASYKTDDDYKFACARQLMADVSRSFKLRLRFDYAAEIFGRFANDIYALQRMGIPVARLYATRFEALRCLRRSDDEPAQLHRSSESQSIDLFVCAAADDDDQHSIYNANEIATSAATGRAYGACSSATVRLQNLFSNVTAAYAQSTNFDYRVHSEFRKYKKGHSQPLGFQTGSGKPIKVDNESMRISAHLFSDISGEDERNLGDSGGGSDSLGEIATVCGFKTSSGRAINVDNESMRISARLFSDISTEGECNFGGGGGGCGRTSSSFKRGSGRAIGVDDESMRISARLFSDISTKSERGSGDGGNKIRMASSFETGSGRVISVDDDSLRSCAQLVSNISSMGECSFSGGVGGKTTTVVGFKTGSGKIINVDDSRLRVSSLLFSDTLNEASASTARHFKTVVGTGNVVDVRVESLEEKCDYSLADSSTLSKNERNERECVQNQSFDLCREITESASAFLYDISHEQSQRSFFAPNESDVNARGLDVEETAGSSRSCSPVFVSKYESGKRKNWTRKSGGRQSLNITYVRKTRTSDGDVADDTAGSDSVCSELETLKMNFSSKASKRKWSWTDDSSSQVAAKKCRNLASASELALTHSRPTPSAAVVPQPNYISNKPKQHCRPTRGYLSTLIYGGDDRISLGRLARYEKPKLYSFDEYVKFGLLPVVIRVNSQNARRLVFTSQFFNDQQLKNAATGTTLFGDAVPLLFNEKNQITLEEVTAGFLASPGVDPKLVTREWIANHYRWIVWKLASTERFFPKSLARRYLTLDNVLFQLKFKYEQEVDRCIRCALKRILEGDDSPARPIILCVASIVKEAHSSNQYKMELTDGWYSIFSQTDHQIDDLIARKKLLVGSKLIIAGAELVGLSQPCDPLQVSENVRLKFSANSSRRVRWNTRLGFYTGSVGPINRIRTILPKGGFISHFTAVVARVYPPLYLEKYDDAVVAAADVSATATTNTTWSRLHNEKVEMKKAITFERDRQNFIESILSQVTNQVLNENVETDADTFADNERVRDVIRQKVQRRLPVKFSKNRRVSRLLKLRLVDAQDAENKPTAILTIWNPCDDVDNFFTEGRSYRFFNINANCIRNGELQLCSTRSSKYDVDCRPTISDDNVNGCWFARRVRNVDDFNQRCENDDKSSLSFDEADVIGIVIRIEPKVGYEQQSCRVYLADLQRRFLALSFRIDPENFDFGDSIENGKIVAGLNLQWKNGWLCWRIPVLYVSESSSFVQSTNIGSLRQSIDQVRRYFRTRNLETFVAECEQELRAIVDSAVHTRASANDNAAGESVYPSGVDRAAPSAESDSCCKARLGVGVAVAVGNQAKFKNPDMRCKFERLQNYGRPPPLSPIVLTSQSKIKANLSLPVSRT